jgi:hypothetical protein
LDWRGKERKGKRREINFVGVERESETERGRAKQRELWG